MVNPKPKPTPPSAKRTSAAWTPVSRAHQPTSSSLRKIPKYEVSSAAEPETPVRKGAAAQTPKSSTAASRKIATRQQTPQRHISVSTDPSTGTELTRESESQLPLKTKKRSPNSWGKIAARSPAQKKQLSRESSGDIRSVTGTDSSTDEGSTNGKYKHLLSKINRMLCLECDKLWSTMESNHAKLELAIRELDVPLEETKEAVLSYVRELKQHGRGDPGEQLAAEWIAGESVQPRLSHDGKGLSGVNVNIGPPMDSAEEQEEEEEKRIEAEEEGNQENGDQDGDGGADIPSETKPLDRLTPITERSESGLSPPILAIGKANRATPPTPRVFLPTQSRVSKPPKSPIGSRLARIRHIARRRQMSLRSSPAGGTSSEPGTESPLEGESGVRVISIQNSRAILEDIYRSFGEDFVPFRPPPDVMDGNELDRPLREWRDATPDIAGILNVILARYTPGVKISSPHTHHPGDSSSPPSPTPEHKIGGRSLGRSNRTSESRHSHLQLGVTNEGPSRFTIGQEAVSSLAGRKRGFETVRTGADVSARATPASSSNKSRAGTTSSTPPQRTRSSPPSSAKPGYRSAKGTPRGRRSQRVSIHHSLASSARSSPVGGVPVNAPDREGDTEERPAKKQRTSASSTGPVNAPDREGDAEERLAKKKRTSTSSTRSTASIESTPTKTTPGASASVVTGRRDRGDHQTDPGSASKGTKSTRAATRQSKVLKVEKSGSPAKRKERRKKSELEESKDVYEVPASPGPEPDPTPVTRSGRARAIKGRGGTSRARGRGSRARK